MALTYEIIGQRLRTARELTGLKQSQVANYLGINRVNVSYFETGARQIDTITLSKLADLYGFSLSHFLADNENDENTMNFSAAFRTNQLSPEDLATLAWAKKFAKNLNSIQKLLED